MSRLNLKSFLKLDETNAPISMIVVVGLVMIAAMTLIAIEVDRTRKDFYAAREQLAFYRSEVWMLDRLNAITVNQELEKELSRFSSGENIAVLIEEITKSGKGFEISFVSISPKEKAQLSAEEDKILSHLLRVPIDMHVTGSYQNISLFLSQLSKLSRGVVKIDQFRITKHSSDAAHLEAVLSVSAYVPKDDRVLASELNSDFPILPREVGKTRFRELGRNPFSVWHQKTVDTDLVLEGILYDASKPVALINGKIWHVGDQIENTKILEIKQASVLIEKDGEQETIKLRTG